MKNFLIISVQIFIFISCSTTKMLYNVYCYSVDYSEYTNKGFFITESNSVSFDYEPVGSIYAEISSGHEALGFENDTIYDSLYKSQFLLIKEMISKNPRQATSKDAINALYEKSIDLGANGIINLQLKYIPEVYNNKQVLLSGSKIIATGMAIKK